MANPRPEQRNEPWKDPGATALRTNRQGHEEVRRLRRGRRRLAQHLQGRDLLPAGRLGLRQDHVAADDGGFRDADRGHDLDRRRGHDRRAALRAAGQHDVPVLRAVPAHDGARRTSRSGCTQDKLPKAEIDGARRRDPEARAHGAVRRPQAAPALGRPAPARRARPRAGQAPEAAAARRAARRARQEAARAHAVRADQHPGDARRHLRGRHARPGRGDDARHAHRRDGPGRDRPDRHAGGDLRISRARASSPTSSARSTCSRGA